MKFIKLILFVLFGLLFMNAGLDKFFHYMPVPQLGPEMVKVGEAFNSIVWLMPLVGIIEFISGLLFLFPKTRFLGALMIFPIMVAIMVHTVMYTPSGLPLALAFFIIDLWVLYLHKGRLKILVY